MTQKRAIYFSGLNLYRKEITGLFASCLIIYVLFYFFIDKSGKVVSANQWLIQSLVVLLIVFYQTVTRLDKNRLETESSLYPFLGWANCITIYRGILIAFLGGYLFQPIPREYLAWFPGLIYTIVAIIDRVDGYVARITRTQSLLGSELDMVFDAIGLLVAPLLAVGYGQLHWSYLLVSAAYYLFQLGIYIRRRRGLEVIRLLPNMSRRAMAGFQMGFVAAVLLPVFQPPVTKIAGAAFMVPLLSGFITDWLIVRGTLTIGSQISAFFDRLKSLGENLMLPLLRLLIVILAIIFFIDNSEQVLSADQINTVYILSVAFATFFLVLIITGFIGRTGAVLLAIYLGLSFQDQMLSTIDSLLLCSVIWVMMLGTGNYSLYKPDEDWVNRYDGT